MSLLVWHTKNVTPVYSFLELDSQSSWRFLFAIIATMVLVFLFWMYITAFKLRIDRRLKADRISEADTLAADGLE